ncbi:hypothetical protein EV384_1433 [Micromonospora kangleipakensis]|uniref:Uncharacterized protein n=1 Tax=Micromonospora kangleipakensis TaxID=1077942 RepID=A0A4Q8B837_9ACTN|nr:hypothetical protein EV384_1433 [Micromonospora kangleipakensis]
MLAYLYRDADGTKNLRDHCPSGRAAPLCNARWIDDAG